MLTQSILKDKLDYNPDSGLFYWLPRPRSTRKNPIAGCRMLNGYITIRVNKKAYLAHRLAFLFMEGSFPEQQVDHINRDRSDNRWCNLRKSSPSENNQNRTPKEGLPTGICKVQRKGRKGDWYLVAIQCNYQRYSSFYRNLDDAIEWRRKKENELFR